MEHLKDKINKLKTEVEKAREKQYPGDALALNQELDKIEERIAGVLRQ